RQSDTKLLASRPLDIGIMKVLHVKVLLRINDEELPVESGSRNASIELRTWELGELAPKDVQEVNGLKRDTDLLQSDKRIIDPTLRQPAAIIFPQDDLDVLLEVRFGEHSTLVILFRSVARVTRWRFRPDVVENATDSLHRPPGRDPPTDSWPTSEREPSGLTSTTTDSLSSTTRNGPQRAATAEATSATSSESPVSK